jgi:hypothetical protein
MQMAEGGLAALSLPDDMFDEESYAGGGIVAFDEGGLTEDNIAYQQALQGVELPSLARIGLDYTALLPYTLGKKGIGYLQGRQPVFDPEQGKYVLQRDFGKEQDRRTKTKEFLAKEADAQLSDPAYLAGVNKFASERDNALAMATNKGVPSSDEGIKTLADSAKLTGDKQQVARSQSAVGAPRQAGYGDLKFNNITVDDAGYGELMPEQRSMRDYAAEYKSELGEDPGRAAMKENLAKMRATGEKEAERAPWMALAEAGLGMAAGQSQFALQNIATGGIRGIQSFNEARDRLVKAEERRFDLENKLSQAERAEQLAAINYGADSKRADDQNRRAVGLAKQADKARAAEVNAKGQYDAISDRYKLSQEDRKLAVTAEHYKDWYNVSLENAKKSLQGIEKQGIQQQTQILNNALDETNRAIIESRKLGDEAAVIAGTAKLEAIEQRLFEMTGVKYSPPTGGGTLVKDKSGKMVYQPQSK